VPDAPVATEVHEALDVHRDFAAQIAFDREACNGVAQPGNLGLAQILDLSRRVDLRGDTRLERAAAADAVDLRQRDRHVLVDGNVDSGNTCHALSPSSPVSACAADRCR
jgi:hypothetical protein